MMRIAQCYFIILFMITFTKAGMWDIQSDSTLNINKVGPKTESVEVKRYQQIYYVSMEFGSDKSGDGTEDKPWQTLIYAMSTVNDASKTKRYAICVAKGIYDNATIFMKDYVDMYGGFEPNTWERDIFDYATILDGKNVRRVVVGANHARLDGFIIKHGLGRSHGGGILCDDTSPMITNNFIIENMVLEPGNFNSTRIHQEGSHGGGIACLYNAVPVIRNNIFYGNCTSIGNGAGLAFYGWVRLAEAPETEIKDNVMIGGLRSLVENNVFIGNTSGVNDTHRTRSSSGGAIACAFEARPIIRNNVVAGNEARGRSDAGGIYCEYFSYPLIEGNWIAGNIGDDDGGGIYVMKMSHSVIENNIIAGNWTTGGGAGGVRLSKEGRARIKKNIIVLNPGGGVISVDSFMELEDNIIMHNSKASGLLYRMNFSYMLPSLVQNNIIRENEEGAISITDDDKMFLNLKNNNIDIDSREMQNGTYNKDPGFMRDGIEGYITSVHYDFSTYTTSLDLKEPLQNINLLPGRLLSLGNQWGVIKALEPGKLVVWGNFSSIKNIDQKYEIIPSYSQK